jgi:hypothetical protein
MAQIETDIHKYFCEIRRILRILQQLDIAYKQVTLQNIKKGMKINRGSIILSEKVNSEGVFFIYCSTCSILCGNNPMEAVIEKCNFFHITSRETLLRIALN